MKWTWLTSPSDQSLASGAQELRPRCIHHGDGLKGVSAHFGTAIDFHQKPDLCHPPLQGRTRCTDTPPGVPFDSRMLKRLRCLPQSLSLKPFPSGISAADQRKPQRRRGCVCALNFQMPLPEPDKKVYFTF